MEIEFRVAIIDFFPSTSLAARDDSVNLSLSEALENISSSIIDFFSLHTF